MVVNNKTQVTLLKKYLEQSIKKNPSNKQHKNSYDSNSCVSRRGRILGVVSGGRTCQRLIFINENTIILCSYFIGNEFLNVQFLSWWVGHKRNFFFLSLVSLSKPHVMSSCHVCVLVCVFKNQNICCSFILWDQINISNNNNNTINFFSKL